MTLIFAYHFPFYRKVSIYRDVITNEIVHPLKSEVKNQANVAAKTSDPTSIGNPKSIGHVFVDSKMAIDVRCDAK